MADNRKILASIGGAACRPYPILKWAGGKSQLLVSLSPLIPAKFKRYFEPFVGGGAVFFHLISARPGLSAYLADYNAELINCYQAVRDDVEAVIKALKKHRNESEYFYHVRALDTATLTPAERAARLIYLNKTCFNGLYRVNRQGQFNVPFGSYKNPRTCDESNLRLASQALEKVQLHCAHFSQILRHARRGDFVYLDPPYQSLSATSNFTSYTSHCFGEDDQKELAETVKQLDKRGCYVMLSNSDNQFIRRLYADFRIETVWANRAINCKGNRRGRISEVVVLNY